MPNPTRVIVAGAGRIGSLISSLLAESGRYTVYLIDIQAQPEQLSEHAQLHFHQMDVGQTIELSKFIRKIKAEAIISCLPYYCNLTLAHVAADTSLHYFDLTEDIMVRDQVKKLTKKLPKIFAPSCGLAPGLINIIAQDLISRFQQADEVKLRVGCLPLLTDNALRYALTWSTDGIINEYGNPCQAIAEGRLVTGNPLEGLEDIYIDGDHYEAFNTSGGVGTLVETYKGKIRNLNYKSIRYPGHCAKMKFLMQDLKLNEKRGLLKEILESVLPQITEDVTILYASVQGLKNGVISQEVYSNKFYPCELFGQRWTSIQATTAASACAVIDILLTEQEHLHGFVPQEKVAFQKLLNNSFGKLLNLHEKRI